MRRWHLVVLLLILAAALAVSLAEHGERHITTYVGYREVATRPDAPLLTYFGMVADTFCPSGRPDEPCAFATERGFFARPGVPRLAALLGGVVLPPLLVLGALGVAVRRRWLRVPLLWLSALFLFAMMLHIPGEYFSGVSAADVQRQIAARGIYVTKIDTGMDCLGTKPCFATPFYAFTTGVFATDGVPRQLAVILGLIVPGLLLFGSVVVAFRPEPRRTTS